MQTSNVRISKYMKLNTRKQKIWSRFVNSSYYNFCIFIIRQKHIYAWRYWTILKFKSAFQGCKECAVLQLSRLTLVNYQTKIKAKQIWIFVFQIWFYQKTKFGLPLRGFTICHSTNNVNKFWRKLAPKHG